MTLLRVGKASDKCVEETCARWAGKCARYAPFAEVRLKAGAKKTSADADMQRSAEAERVLARVDGGAYLVAFDERGREHTTESLAGLLADASDVAGPAGVVFAIGGPYGWHQSVRDRADATVRLSRLVLNHEVARIVALEAIYRSHTVLRGEPYHH